VEDREIVALLWARSETAITRLLERYGRLAQSVARRIVQNEQDAQECVSDAALAVWNTVPPERPASLRAYFCTVTRHHALNRYRYNTAARRRGDLLWEELDSLADTASAEEDTAALGAAVSAWLRTQPKEARLLFMKRYYLGESVAELAAFFGIRENNVSVRLTRLRASLRAYLKKEGIEV